MAVGHYSRWEWGKSPCEICETGAPKALGWKGSLEVTWSNLLLQAGWLQSQISSCSAFAHTQEMYKMYFVFKYGNLSPSDTHRSIVWVTVGIWLIFQIWLIFLFIKSQCSLCCSLPRWIPAFGGKRKWWLSLVLIYQFLPRPHVPCTAWLIKSLYQ